MPLVMSDNDAQDIMHPLSAVVVLKYLDKDGESSYIVRATNNVTTVEALGMAHYATAKLTEAVADDV